MNQLPRRSPRAFAFAGLLLAFTGLTAFAQISESTTPLTPEQIYARLDPQLAKVLTLYNQIKGTPIVELNPQRARQQFSMQDAAKLIARASQAAPAALPLGKTLDGLTIPGVNLNQIPIRIYTPAGAGPFPVILYFHGGGFVIATIDTYDSSARALSYYAKAIVVSIEYRKAPEVPFPGAQADAVAAYEWVLGNIGRYNGIPAKVAVAGESAGGNLATEVALAARDQGLQPPTCQLLIYPVTSSNLNQQSDLLYTSSVLPLTTAGLQYFFKNYVQDPAYINDPAVAPTNAFLGKLPPATIIAAELDPLESDGKEYAKRLQAAGNTVDYRVYYGVTHEFFGLSPAVEKARAAEQYGAAKIAASFK